MEIRQIFIVLVDISGYTRFIKLHRKTLLHAEGIITELLKRIIESSKPPLVLHELEGDAVNFYALSDGTPEMARDIGSQVLGFIDAFRQRERELVSECGPCSCEACQSVGKLKLKAVLHHGEAAFTKIRQFEKIGGEDVILAHRLLKNSIERDEYILLSASFFELCERLNGKELEDRREYCEGIGEVNVKVHYTEPAAFSEPVKASSLSKFRTLAKLGGYMIKRLYRPSAKFRHLRAQWKDT